MDDKLSYLRYIDSFNVVFWEEMAVLGALRFSIFGALNGTNLQTKYWFSKNLGINVSNVTKSSICEKAVKSETKHYIYTWKNGIKYEIYTFKRTMILLNLIVCLIEIDRTVSIELFL